MAATVSKKSTSPKAPATELDPTTARRIPGVGVDIGTANIAVCRYYNTKTPNPEGGPDLNTAVSKTNLFRDCFIVLPADDQHVLEASGVPFHLSDDATRLLILGDDAVTYAAALGGDLRRPLAKGFISDKEDLSKEVVRKILESLLGVPLIDGELAVFSIPGVPLNALDAASAKFHTRFFSERLKELGYTPIPLNEAMAVCYSELRPDTTIGAPKPAPGAQVYTGMTFSFGAGMINVALAFKGMLIRAFSIPYGGDFIDEAVARSTNTSVAQITVLKEEGIDLLNHRVREAMPYHDDKSERQAEAISLMYRELLSKIREALVDFFALPTNRLDIREHIPVIVSGGTTRADGFLSLFDEFVLDGLDIRLSLAKNCIHAQMPMTSVAQGALHYASMRQAKLNG